MKRKMLRVAGILGLCVTLSLGMAGCAGDDEPGLPSIQSITIHDDGETGNSSRAGDDSDAGSDNETKDSDDAESNTEGSDASGEGKEESVYFEGADLNGRVLEFSDTGFTMTPIHTVVFEDGTRNSWEAAPGKEKEEDSIYVTYTDDTVFETVYFSMSLQEVSSREDADKSSVKVQTCVYVFGSSQDGKNWTADKVLIQKWN